MCHSFPNSNEFVNIDLMLIEDKYKIEVYDLCMISSQQVYISYMYVIYQRNFVFIMNIQKIFEKIKMIFLYAMYSGYRIYVHISYHITFIYFHIYCIFVCYFAQQIPLNANRYQMP